LGTFVGPAFFAAFVVFLLYTGGIDSLINFVIESLGFLGRIILGCPIFGAIWWSIQSVYNRVEEREGTDSAVISMFLWILIGLPLALIFTGFIFKIIFSLF